MGESNKLKYVKTGRFEVLGLSSEQDAQALPPIPFRRTAEVASTAATTTTTKSAKPVKNESSKKQSNTKKASKSASKEEKEEKAWTDALQQDYDRIRSVGEECITEGELKSLLLAKRDTGFNFYDGFEPSGRMHIAQGVFKAMNVNKCTASGGTFVFWVADWFALMNDKMGGDLDKIRIVGDYLQEVWKAAGMDLSNVVFSWASDEIISQAHVYWPLMLDVARRFNITRIKKCCQIMGRLEGSLTAAQILYPLMQCTDVFFLKADICQLGVDQRKVNMLAREYCDFAKHIKRKPVILSHHMLYGLKQGQEKMSKSDPDSAVFMEDTAADVERKIMNAYCPQQEQETTNKKEEEEDAGKQSMHLKVDNLKNPCLDYIEHIIFSPPNATFAAGGQTYQTFATVKEAFLSGALKETELKQALIQALNNMLEPVRKHFTENERAKSLLEQVRRFKKETSSGTTTQKTVRRLNLVELEKIPAQSHLVMAPLPTATPTLQQAMTVLAQLRASTTKDQARVLYLTDWTARVVNACDADPKAIAAFYHVLLTALRALDATLMESTSIVWQSEGAILLDPSNYWVSVINVGRHFALKDVMGEDDLVDADAVGRVIARLMMVADVMGVEPTSLALPNHPTSTVLSKLVAEFYTSKLDDSMTPPTVQITDGPVLLLHQRESVAHKTDNDEYFLMDDPKIAKSKMKKAFCEPGNTLFCPPVTLSSTFTFPEEALVISRSPENGGDVTYTNQAELEKDFGSGALHPGDLKAAASAKMVTVLEKISQAIKADGDASKGGKTLKAFAKKKAKSKGKK